MEQRGRYPVPRLPDGGDAGEVAGQTLKEQKAFAIEAIRGRHRSKSPGGGPSERTTNGSSHGYKADLGKTKELQQAITIERLEDKVEQLERLLSKEREERSRNERKAEKAVQRSATEIEALQVDKEVLEQALHKAALEARRAQHETLQETDDEVVRLTNEAAEHRSILARLWRAFQVERAGRRKDNSTYNEAWTF